MDVEAEWIYCLVDSGDFTVALDNNVTPDFFGDEDHRRVFEFIRGHYAKYAEVPSRQAIKANWPSYKLPVPTDSFAYAMDELRKQYTHAQVRDSLLDIQEALNNGDGELALAYMQTASSQITTAVNPLRDEVLNDTWEERLAGYLASRNMTGLIGLPTGFKSIDQATMGLQDEQLISLIGLPKSGKSTLALVIAIAVADFLPPEECVLVIGFEMSNKEQGARYDAFTSHVSHHAMLSGGITDEMAGILEITGRQREGKAKMILAADPSGMTTLSGVAAKIDEYKPRLVVIDGAYLMDDENGEPKGTSQALTNITRGGKRLCQQKKVPIMMTTQALASKVQKRSGVTVDSIGYTSSFAQDSDLVLAVMADEDDPTQQVVRVAASRIGPNVEATVRWDWARGTFEEVVEDDIKKAGTDREPKPKVAGVAATLDGETIKVDKFTPPSKRLARRPKPVAVAEAS
jgi:replicative DNA helicase